MHGGGRVLPGDTSAPPCCQRGVRGPVCLEPVHPAATPRPSRSHPVWMRCPPGGDARTLRDLPSFLSSRWPAMKGTLPLLS